VKQAHFVYVNDARIRSWDQLVLSLMPRTQNIFILWLAWTPIAI